MSDSDKEQPEEAKETVYERDKTAKGPEIEGPDASQIKPPVVKPRKVFKAKKVEEDLDPSRERRTRHIRVSTPETAEMIRQVILDYQEELAAEPTDDLDKEYGDRDKVEKFFSRLAKKYSACPSKALGGDLDWTSQDSPVDDETTTRELMEAISKTRKFDIPEPVKTKLGYHIILVCETRAPVKAQVDPNAPEHDPRYAAMMARPNAQAPTRKDIPT